MENLSANTDLVIESKARWDAGGKELYGQKVVGTGPFEFVERKVGSHVLYANGWRTTGARRRNTRSSSSAGCPRVSLAWRPCWAMSTHL